MKKIFYLFIALLLFSGCTDLSNTPTKRVEDFMKKFQTLDNDVLTDLDSVIDQQFSLNNEQSDKYRDIMKKHYQNLTYEIKDDIVDGDNARVTVEITVTDFSKILDETEIYMNNNLNEFNDDLGNYSIMKYNDYRLERLKGANDKVKYTIYFNLIKVNDQWILDDIDQVTYDKINGMYRY